MKGAAPTWRYRAQRAAENSGPVLLKCPESASYEDARRDFDMLAAEWSDDLALDRSNHGLT